MGNGYAMTDRNIDLSSTIIKLHEQQQYMRDYRIHSVVYLRLHIPKEGDGFLLLYKRMEAQGRFRRPRNSEEVRSLTWQQFNWLMSGMEIEQPKFRYCTKKEEKLKQIPSCGCFAHLRRYFVEAVPKGKELDYSNPAAQGVQYINRLFEQERYSASKNHTPEQRYAYRLEKEKRYWMHSGNGSRSSLQRREHVWRRR